MVQHHHLWWTSQSSTCFSLLKTEATCLYVGSKNVFLFFFISFYLRETLSWGLVQSIPLWCHFSPLLQAPHVQIFLSNHLAKFFSVPFSPHVFTTTFLPCRVQARSVWIGSNCVLVSLAGLTKYQTWGSYKQKLLLKVLRLELRSCCQHGRVLARVLFIVADCFHLVFSCGRKRLIYIPDLFLKEHLQITS